MPPNKGARATHQIIDEAQVLMAGPDSVFKPLGFLQEDGFAWSANGGEHQGVDLATNAHQTPSVIERSWSFTPIDVDLHQLYPDLEERNSYATRVEQPIFEYAATLQGRKNTRLLDLLFGPPEEQQAQLLRRLNMRWRDRIEPGIPPRARAAIPGPPEPKHYVYAKMDSGQTIIGAITDVGIDAVLGTTHRTELTIDPQRSKHDPAFNLTNPKG